MDHIEDDDDDDSRLAGSVLFYRQRDFGGQGESYKLGDDITFWEGDDFNDKYQSVKITGKIKVYCYQHSHGNGVYRVFPPGQYNDLSAMGGLSKFWVGEYRDPNPPKPKPGPQPVPEPEPVPEPGTEHDWALAFRLVDDLRNDNNESERYEGRFAVAGLGTKTAESEPVAVPDPQQRYVQLNGRGDIDQINCAVQAFHWATNVLVATAQVVFKYDARSGAVSIVKNVPQGLQADISVVQRDNTRFDVTLSLKPGVEPPEDLLRIERAVWNGTPQRFAVEGSGTVGAGVVAQKKGAKEKAIAVVAPGGRWAYEGSLPQEGLVQGPHPDGGRRLRFFVEQRNSGVARARSDVLYMAPVIESPLELSQVGHPLPAFSGTAEFNRQFKPWVMLSTQDGEEIGRAKVNEDGSWSMQPQADLPSGLQTLHVQCIFPEIPAVARLTPEVRPFWLDVS